MKKVVITVFKILFFAVFAFGAAEGFAPDMPSKKWYEKTPVWVLIILNFLLLSVVGLIIWAIVVWTSAQKW